MPENESYNKSGYNGPTDDDVKCLIREDFEKPEKIRLESLIDDRYERTVLALIQDAHGNSMGSYYTLTFKVVEQRTVKSFFFEKADELLDVLQSLKTSHKFSLGTL